MNTRTDLIGEMVAEDFRTAAVFKKYGIDFCCKGGRTIADACEKKNIDKEKIIEELENLPKTDASGIDFNSFPIDLLADYVEKTHHRYVEEKTPIIQQFLDKLCKVHGDRHPELFEINAIFNESARDLAAHLKKEELVLFPFIKQMVKAKISGEDVLQPHFGTVENPVNMMMHEHTTEGERFEKIAQLTQNYAPPADACNTYRVTFAMLQDFENDLHKHIHLENNILFPKSIKLEKEFVAV
ncbi:iron-sulfur cluster repair di-iron protein [Kaistella haifensis DSM 19056]|uniref:Iron-sulfur cluster repair di-iron protein n=1 Tax=Kaistella haifensis DSM 19056 TaxID=1450526 RepID=A0A246B900_9FLAO|nr:iron-sulfur cluster repair di-iron protein [Kaistella haifensis]OWK97937.1 iron-sulfur cluster repair di-iron protein [Kaistella haifensis DSM 19056]